MGPHSKLLSIFLIVIFLSGMALCQNQATEQPEESAKEDPMQAAVEQNNPESQEAQQTELPEDQIPETDQFNAIPENTDDQETIYLETELFERIGEDEFLETHQVFETSIGNFAWAEDLNKIPKGWRPASLKEFTKFQNQLVIPNQEQFKGRYAIIDEGSIKHEILANNLSEVEDDFNFLDSHMSTFSTYGMVVVVREEELLPEGWKLLKFRQAKAIPISLANLIHKDWTVCFEKGWITGDAIDKQMHEGDKKCDRKFVVKLDLQH